MSLDPLHDPDFLTSLRRDMLRFAELQLRDRAQAEDAVQEALTGALLGKEKFASRASLRTWVLSILKNKIIDVLRRKVREHATVNPENDDDLNAFSTTGRTGPKIRARQNGRHRSRQWKASSSGRSLKPAFTACLITVPAFSPCAKYSALIPTKSARPWPLPPATALSSCIVPAWRFAPAWVPTGLAKRRKVWGVAPSFDRALVWLNR
jgi:RNA polymerase sigma factor (sigma-70 family)